MQRTIWIDLLRGWCMMAILWFHTEVYYTGYNFTPYAFYVEDVLAIFFFLSGYLLYNGKPINLKYKLSRILHRLIIPYFIFSCALVLPKAFIHHQNINFWNTIWPIINGNSSWFITALTVSQLLFIITLSWTKGNLWKVSTIAFMMLLLSYFVGNSFDPSPLFNPYNIWHINEAFLGYFVIAIGYIYHVFENRIIPSQHHKYLCITLVLGILFVIIKYYIWQTTPQLIFGTIIVSNYPLFIINMIVAILLYVFVFKLLSDNKMIRWTGSHCIVYYFLCGGIPLVIGKLFNSIGFIQYNYLGILLVFCIVYVVTTTVVWIIYKLLPNIVN